MIESTFRKTYQKYCIDPLLDIAILRKLHPSWITLIACLLGCSIPFLLAVNPIYSLTCLILSGFLDTLDGSLARHTGKTSNLGAALDIVFDRIVECVVITGLMFVEPLTRATPSLMMLGSAFICVTSFLVVGIFTPNHSQKGFHYSPGLIERAEAFCFFAAMILFPSFFIPLAYLFSCLVLLTSAIRMVQFSKMK